MRAHPRLLVRFGFPAVGLAASAIYMGLPNDSSACMCVCLRSPEEELAAYDLVFHGRVTDVHDVVGCGRTAAILKFEVLEGFRGAEAGDWIGVSMHNENSSCAVSADAYAVGDELILFTDADNPWLSQCHPRVRSPNGSYNACSTDDTGDPGLTFDEVVAALQAAEP